MHLSDCALPFVTIVGFSGATAAGVAVSLRRLDPERIPQAAVLGSAFFVASLIHVPLGISSVHLVLNGLLGMILGWVAVPTILVALLLQAVFFGHGGLTVLGVNAFVMAAPAVLVWYACGIHVHRGASRRRAFTLGFCGGAAAVFVATLLQAGVLLTAGDDMSAVAAGLAVSGLPLAVAEGFITAHALVFLLAVRPETLAAAPVLASGIGGRDA